MSGNAFPKAVVLAILFAPVSVPALAQEFTSAAEVRPILEATKRNWLAVREFDGQDLVYFTHLLAWRCGLSEIHYAINGGEEQRFAAEPCYDTEPLPNALKAEDIMPYVSFELGSVDNVSVRIVYDDGGAAAMTYPRDAIIMP